MLLRQHQQQPNQVARTLGEQLSGQGEYFEDESNLEVCFDYNRELTVSTASTLQMSDTWRSSRRKLFPRVGSKEDYKLVEDQVELSNLKKGNSSRWLNDRFRRPRDSNTKGGTTVGLGAPSTHSTTAYDCDNYDSNDDILNTNPRFDSGAIPKTNQQRHSSINKHDQDVHAIEQKKQQQGSIVDEYSRETGGEKKYAEDILSASNYNCNSSVNLAKNLQEAAVVARDDNDCKDKGPVTAISSRSSCWSGGGRMKQRVRRKQQKGEGNFNSNTSPSGDGRKYEALSLHYYLTHCCPTATDQQQHLHHHHHQRQQQQQRHQHQQQRDYEERLTRFCAENVGNVAPVASVSGTSAEQQRHHRNRSEWAGGNANVSCCDNSSGNDECCTGLWEENSPFVADVQLKNNNGCPDGVIQEGQHSNQRQHWPRKKKKKRKQRPKERAAPNSYISVDSDSEEKVHNSAPMGALLSSGDRDEGSATSGAAVGRDNEPLDSDTDERQYFINRDNNQRERQKLGRGGWFSGNRRTSNEDRHSGHNKKFYYSKISSSRK